MNFMHIAMHTCRQINITKAIKPILHFVLFLQIFNQVLPKPSPLHVDGEKGWWPHWTVGQSQGAIPRMLEARVEEAAEKTRMIRQWTTKLDREAMILRGQLQRIGNMATHDLPKAARWLASLEEHLQGYTQSAPPMPDPLDGPTEATEGRGRGGTQQTAEETDQ